MYTRLSGFCAVCEPDFVFTTLYRHTHFCKLYARAHTQRERERDTQCLCVTHTSTSTQGVCVQCVNVA